jgi:predicted nicotinamide N-methyase
MERARHEDDHWPQGHWLEGQLPDGHLPLKRFHPHIDLPPVWLHRTWNSGRLLI